MLKLLSIFLLLALAIISIGLFFTHPFFSVNVGEDAPFTAVFLTNDQVYFGRIVEETKEILVLQNVYYLKTSSSVVSVEGVQEMQNTVDAETTRAKLLLVKVGNELHRPHDTMKINRNQVLFTEEMKKEGPIMTAILADLDRH